MKINKKIILIILLGLVIAVFPIWRSKIVFKIFRNPLTNFTNLENVKGCDQTLWNRVYDPDRLWKISDCIKITGTVRWLENEEDGDVHILVHLDEPYKNQINIFNKVLMGGNLVTEMICHGETHDDAKIACGTYKSNITLPKLGQRVEIHGAFVIDSSYGWSEVHPISTLTVLDLKTQ